MKIKIGIYLLRFLAIFPLSVSSRFGSAVGYCNWLFSTRAAKITRTNIKHCYSEMNQQEQKKLELKSLKEMFINAAQMGAIWLWPTKKVLSYLNRVEDLDILKRAVAENNGVVLLVPHIGNWEFLGLYIENCGQGELYSMYQPPKNPDLGKLIYSARSRSGNKLLPASIKGVALSLTALRGGGIVAILPDQVPTISGGIYTRFFGKPALSMTLVSRLLQKTGCKAVFASALRATDEKGGGNRFNIKFTEPSVGIYSRDLNESVQCLNDGIEELVKANPEQYQWEYKRFKKQASGSKIYS